MVHALIGFLLFGADPVMAEELVAPAGRESELLLVEEVAAVEVLPSAVPAPTVSMTARLPGPDIKDWVDLREEEQGFGTHRPLEDWFEWIKMGERDSSGGLRQEIGPVVGVLLRPMREVNLLLPEKLDPFAAAMAARDVPESKFSYAKQQELLGDGLTGRADAAEGKAVWHWQLQGGGSFRQGNSSNTNVRGGVQAERRSNQARILARVDGTYDHNGDSTGFNNRNRRFFGELLLDRNLRGRWLLYGREQGQYDEAALVLLRSVTSTGLGFRFVDSLRQRIVVRSGPTVSQVIYAQTTKNDSEFKSGWMFESEYRQLIGELTRFQWTTSAYPDFDSEQQLRVRSEASMIFPIGKLPVSRWNWKLGATHEYQLNPVPGAKSSDVTGYFSILYAN